jgi:glycosyltransferase involved in cell wall biosynthesis
MKVLAISQYFPPDIGGSSTRAFNAATGLHKKGCNVKVVTAFPHYPHGNVSRVYRRKAIQLEEMDGIKLIRVWIPALPHNSIVNRVVLHLSFITSSLFAIPFVGKVDVIWAASPNLFSFLPALIYSFVERKPIIRNVDDLWPEVFYDLNLSQSRLLKRLLDFLAWLSYTVPSAITPISPAYKPRIIEKYRIDKNKIHVIEVGVNDVIAQVPSQKKEKSRFVVMYSGILGLGYDFETVLEAAELLKGQKDVLFVIRGIGECEYDIRRTVERLKLDNVKLDTSFLSKPQLASVLNSADVFLLPMRQARAVEEGLPTKIFEYQAFGKPIICSSRGEPAAYISSTKSGLVVQPGDAEALAQAILKLHRDEKLASELGISGYRHVCQNLTSERIGERLYTVFLSGMRTKSRSWKC